MPCGLLRSLWPRSREDFHLQASAHAGHTDRMGGQEAPIRNPIPTLTAALLLTGTLLTGAAAAVTPPPLVVEAPPELEAHAERVRTFPASGFRRALKLTGLGDSEREQAPIRVILAAEGSPLAEHAPAWVSGYAYSELGVVVLLPARIQTYPDDSFEDVLVHEVAHVLIARAAGNQPVPRWLHEGVAMLAANEWSLTDRSRLTVALLRARPASLFGLEDDFNRGAGASARAYGVAGSFVRHVAERHGDGWVAALLDGLGQGQSFTEAFRRATGVPFYQAEAEFWKRETFWARWLPVLTSSTLLWILISLLAIFAIYRRRRRDAALMARWEAEETHLTRTPEGEWIH